MHINIYKEMNALWPSSNLLMRPTPQFEKHCDRLINTSLPVIGTVYQEGDWGVDRYFRVDKLAIPGVCTLRQKPPSSYGGQVTMPTVTGSRGGANLRPLKLQQPTLEPLGCELLLHRRHRDVLIRQHHQHGHAARHGQLEEAQFEGGVIGQVVLPRVEHHGHLDDLVAVHVEALVLGDAGVEEEGELSWRMRRVKRLCLK